MREADAPILILTPTEEPPPRKKRARRGGQTFDPTEGEKLALHAVLKRLEALHAGYGWTTKTGRPREFKVVGGMCGVALVCLRDGWTTGRLVQGLRAICWRDARAAGTGVMADRCRNGEYAHLRGMLGKGQRLMPDKSGKLDEALRQYDDAGCPKPAKVRPEQRGAFTPTGQYTSL